MSRSSLFYIYSGLLFFKANHNFLFIIKIHYSLIWKVDFNFSVTQFFVFPFEAFMDLEGYKRNLGASLVSQILKNLSALWEMQVQSLGWEDPLEKGRATHSSILLFFFFFFLLGDHCFTECCGFLSYINKNQP